MHRGAGFHFKRMPRPLTAEQLNALRLVPLMDMPNKVRLALTLTQAQQQQVVEETGILYPTLSKIVTGKSGDGVSIGNARKLADYFGCEVDDLFPRQQAVA